MTINEKSTYIAEIKWPTLPGTGHFCLLAKWDSTSDPPVNYADIDTYVRKNNNVVWHNVNIVSGSGEEKDVSFEMLGRGEIYALQIAPPPAENNGSFLLFGQVVIELDPVALDSWVTNGMLGSGFQFDASTGKITVSDPAGAVLEGIDLPWYGEGPGVYPVALHFTRPATAPARKFHIQATQYMQSPVEILDVGMSSAVSSPYVWIGGVTYELTP